MLWLTAFPRSFLPAHFHGQVNAITHVVVGRASTEVAFGLGDGDGFGLVSSSDDDVVVVVNPISIVGQRPVVENQFQFGQQRPHACAGRSEQRDLHELSGGHGDLRSEAEVRHVGLAIDWLDCDLECVLLLGLEPARVHDRIPSSIGRLHIGLNKILEHGVWVFRWNASVGDCHDKSPHSEDGSIGDVSSKDGDSEGAVSLDEFQHLTVFGFGGLEQSLPHLLDSFGAVLVGERTTDG